MKIPPSPPPPPTWYQVLKYMPDLIGLSKFYNLQVTDGKPNFDQFIDFALENILDHQRHGKMIDNHLNFYWNKCDMCNMHYDIIGKTETADEDLKYFTSKLTKV